MYAWISLKLGHIGVSRKLMIGFGLVLLCTLLIMFTGWSGLNSLIDRGNKIGTIAHISELTRDLRINQQGIAVQGGNNTGDALKRTLGELPRAIEAAKQQLTRPQDLTRLDQQLSATSEYQRALGQLDQALQNRENARSALGGTADKAVELIGNVEKGLLQGENLQRFNSVVTLSKLIQQARFQVRGYTYSGRPEAEQPALDAIEQAETATATLAGSLSIEYMRNLQQATESIKGYRAAVGQYRDSQVASAQALKVMDEQGLRLLDLSQQLTTGQNDMRDSDASHAKSMLMIATALAVFFSVLAGWAITRQIMIPLTHVGRVVDQVAAGDLTQNIDSKRRDELGQLMRGVQRMISGLRELVSGINEGATQIASAAEELSAVTEQTRTGVNSQKVETDQVATAMNEMAATVQEVARNAEQASEAAMAADQQAREGDKVVNEAIAQIERLAKEVGNSTEAMGQLKRESDKIGGVLDVIKSVAQQTNLLALNAAIEAARAGEAGRGFAVVADEVRSLAQRTQKSTEEIEELIAGLQSGTQQVAMVMDNSRTLTDSSVELTRKAGGSLENITRTVSAIQAMNQQIAAAAEQQSAVAEEINRSVLNVRDVSDQTSAASEETAASSVELARLGTHLQALVGKFRV
ncbi:methyl-accepting chemotaxis protein [Pseudomonas abieticivorans]|uniref:methyl-accepting chemotaxis protein n=1 Tax=Pseudomonas abieticivorans TaxID=2931382 RepID=UPI0020BE0441|nr:methyl-accepting chemotaxis protein [Pseudomonas sp. PIA16]